MAALDVSVIIPVHNGERYLADALGSVLAQRHQPAEIIVVDDGSTDASAEVVQRFGERVAYVYQPNKGPAVARNRGLQQARAELIAFLDADDMWHEDKLASQRQRLAADAGLQLVLGHTQFIRQEAGPCEPTRLGQPYAQLFLGAALIRRSAFDLAGMFDESLRCCDDWDWFLRAHDLQLSMQMSPAIVLYYRRHRDNLTRSADSRRCLLRLIRNRLSRQRRNGVAAPTLPAWFNVDQWRDR